MDEVIKIYLPNGLPSENEIREMKDQQQIDELFKKQNEIILHFRRIAMSELNSLDLEIKRSLVKLDKSSSVHVQKEEKTNEKSSNAKSSKTKATKSKVVSTPKRTPVRGKNDSIKLTPKYTPSGKIATTPRKAMTPRKKIERNQKTYSNISKLLDNFNDLIK